MFDNTEHSQVVRRAKVVFDELGPSLIKPDEEPMRYCAHATIKDRKSRLNLALDNGVDKPPPYSIMAGIDFLITRSFAAPASAMRCVYAEQSGSDYASNADTGAAAMPQKIQLSRSFVLMFYRTQSGNFLHTLRLKCSLKLKLHQLRAYKVWAYRPAAGGGCSR